MSDRPNNQKSCGLLEKFGLDDVEAQIYQYLLQNGPRTPLDLSREISLNRSRVYRYVDKLVGKKLIEVTGESRGKKLKASSPGNMELLIQEAEQKTKSQREVLPELLKELTTLPIKLEKEFEVRHYHGQEGIKQMLWNQLSAGKEILAFSYRNKNDMAGKVFAEKIREEQVFRKITLWEVENETDQGDYWYTDVTGWGKYYKSRHILPKVLTIKQYLAVFNNTVAISHWVEGEDVGIEIDNAIFANTQRQIFWKFWEIAGKADK